MLGIPHEIAAIIATKAVVVATVEMGHDPNRAAGALLLELPGLPDRLRAGHANVFWLNHQRKRSETGWSHLERLAEKLGTSANEIWDANRPDVTTPRLERAAS